MNAAADPQPAVTPTPEQLVEQLRALAETFSEGAPLTPAEKRKVRQLSGVSNAVVQAQINLFDVHERVGSAVGAVSADVRQMADESNRWTAVEDQLKRMFQSVYGANLVRRQKLAIIGAQASLVGQALAKNPEFGEIRTQMQEIRRVKRLARRKASPGTPKPQTPAAADQHGDSGM
jgi:predicted GTPase